MATDEELWPVITAGKRVARSEIQWTIIVEGMFFFYTNAIAIYKLIVVR